ncbi:hypothetical protein MMPV_005867 [Pyropia vietnamensis]
MAAHPTQSLARVGGPNERLVLGITAAAVTAIACWVAAAAAAAGAAAQTALRINVGGPALGDFAADVPAAVSGVSTTRIFGDAPITGTAGLPPALYTSFRSAMASSAFSYAFPVENGVYTVSLHFAEVWTGAKAPGKRIFSVMLEGTPVLSSYDLFVDAGADAATVKTYTATVADGTLNIEFVSEVQNAVVMAIEVVPGGGGGGTPSPTPTPGVTATPTPEPTPTATPEPTPVETPTPMPSPTPSQTALRINVGGPALGDFTADIPAAVSGVSTTRIFGDAPITGTAGLPPSLYTSFRSAMASSAFSYAFPVENGVYTVSLHFAEVWTGAKAPGKRIFSVMLEGTPVLSSYDLFVDAGADAATVKTYTATVADGTLNIEFVSEVQNAVVMAIEVVPGGGGGGTPSPTPTPGVTATPTPEPTPTSTPEPTASTTPEPTPTATPNPGGLVTPVKLNVGGPALSDYLPDEPYVTSTTYTGTIVKPVSGTTIEALYHTFRFGKTVAYALPLPPGTYTVSLLFAEVYVHTTAVGKRVFDIAIGDAVAVPVLLPNYDLFADAGEAIAVAKSFDVTVTTAPLIISMTASVQNVALQGIEVVAASPTPTPDPLALPIKLNAGGNGFGTYQSDEPYVASSGTSSGSAVIPIANTADDFLYQSYRTGPVVTYEVPVPPGAYAVGLLFAEVINSASAPGARVFSIALGDGAGVSVEDPAFDIFSTAGSASALRVEFDVTVGTGPLVITMVATAGSADVLIQAVEIYAAGTQPPPPTPADHFAHAVIANTPTAIDSNGDGVELVMLSGVDSHTHRFVDGVAGKLVRFTWVNNDTEVVLAQGVSALVVLPLGSTNVRLEVEDSGGDVSSAYTVITVAGSLSAGAYCYYYDGAEVTFPLPLTVDSDPRPVYAAVSTDLAFPSAADFPAGPHGGDSFVQRCVFFYNAPAAGNYTFSAAYLGGVALYMDAETVFDVSSAVASTASGVVELAEGMHEGVLMYKAGVSPGVTVSVNGTIIPAGSIEWDSSTVLPVLTSISPNTGGVGGGTQVTLTGIGFYTSSTNVFFGGVSATGVSKSGTTTITAQSPPSSLEGTVAVTVKTGGSVVGEGGTSNSLPFSYAGSCPPIKFNKQTVTSSAGGNFFVQSPTSIALGPDGRVYVGTYNSVVVSFAIDANYVASAACTSESVGASRSILSLTFDPLATGDELVLYAATAILFHNQRVGLPIENWNNGQVVKLTPDTNGFCLGVAATPVVSGLPVGNHDHGIQGLAWTQTGELLISVGGMTNMGANVNSGRLGGLDETPLSGAILIAPIRKANFDGAVTYNDTSEERYSVQTGGLDVSVYAAGFRNSFDSVWHTNGNMYATDNGPNEGFGDLAIGCDGSGPSFTKKDELILVSPGNYYGHPNRNRARDDPRQCTYYEPDAPPSEGYTPPLVNLQLSSMNGVLEYMGNHFCGALKHDLIISKFSGQNSNGLTIRAHLGGGGTTVTKLTQLTKFSGLLIIPTASGAILAPQTQKNTIIVYQPDSPPPPTGAAPSVSAVEPHRGPVGGGNTVTIGGTGFGTAPTATLGGKPCTGVKDVAADGTSFRCTAPSGTPGGLVRAVVTRGGDGVASGVTPGNGDYWYMAV